jgi:RNA polymerase sigma factor (sigma-70 family)
MSPRRLELDPADRVITGAVTDQTDGELIAASLSDPGAFARVFDRHFDTVHRFVRRRIGSTVAQDVAAETFLQAFESRKRFDTSRPDALPWLFGIAINLLRHHLRDEERQLRAYARTGVDPIATDERADERLDAQAEGPALAAALADLRAEERDVLLLHAWADLDYAAVAEALDVPVGTVRSRLSRARDHVRAHLTPTVS